MTILGKNTQCKVTVQWLDANGNITIWQMPEGPVTWRVYPIVEGGPTVESSTQVSCILRSGVALGQFRVTASGRMIVARSPAVELASEDFTIVDTPASARLVVSDIAPI